MSLLKLRVSCWIVVALFLSLCFAQTCRCHGSSNTHDEEADAPATKNILSSSGLVLVKIWCLIILFVSTFAGGISPYFYRWNESFLLLGTQFAGGVFLGTSMMHFLSDSNSTFEHLVPNKGYPFAFMLACFGYLLTMFGDCIISFITQRHPHIGSSDITTNDLRIDVEPTAPDHHEEEKQQHITNSGHVDTTDQVMTTPFFLKTASFGDTILLILALCFHSIFEGIAVGVSATKAEAWRNLWTISLHKIFAAIAMGIALLRMIPKRPLLTTAVYSFAFAVSSPVGIGIGIVINTTTQGKSADWTYAISMGIACGVFIYVAINHLIAKGYKPQTKSYFDTPLHRFLAVVFGIGVIAVVMIWD